MTEPAPPRAFPGTPPPPPGNHDLRVVGTVVPKVFLDTSTYFRAAYRNALAASAGVGDLAVYWSSEIRAEIARVAERMVLAATTRRVQRLPPDDRTASIEAALERVRNDLDDQIERASRYILLAPATSAPDASGLGDVADPDDRLHILAARAAGAAYLVTLDNRHLPHGAIFAGVQCWHPDTFLTLFYQQNPDAYTRARRSIGRLPASLRRRLLP